jgi:hypothetical protein
MGGKLAPEHERRFLDIVHNTQDFTQTASHTFVDAVATVLKPRAGTCRYSSSKESGLSIAVPDLHDHLAVLSKCEELLQEWHGALDAKLQFGSAKEAVN